MKNIASDAFKQHSALVECDGEVWDIGACLAGDPTIVPPLGEWFAALASRTACIVLRRIVREAPDDEVARALVPLLPDGDDPSANRHELAALCVQRPLWFRPVLEGAQCEPVYDMTRLA